MTSSEASESSGYFRVRAKVTFTGEYFVPVDEFVLTGEDAFENVRSGLSFVDPENILVDHSAVLAEPVFPTDMDGNPMRSEVEKVARAWVKGRDVDPDAFVAAYIAYVAERKDGSVFFPGDFYRLILDEKVPAL